MKISFILLFCINFFFVSASNSDIIKLRQLYYKAIYSKVDSEIFLATMEKIDDINNPLILCYKGMANLLQAKFYFNPYNKIAAFNKGKYLLEKSIILEPNNIEIRFMRFCTQTKTPNFLKYNKDINTDKIIIIKGWSKLVDVDLKEKIKNFFLESNYCNNKEKNIFK